MMGFLGERIARIMNDKEKDMLELTPDDMDMVSGGEGYSNVPKFYELNGHDQYCVRNGFCPRCNPEMKIDPETEEEKGRLSILRNWYICDDCEFIVQFTD